MCALKQNKPSKHLYKGTKQNHENLSPWPDSNLRSVEWQLDSLQLIRSPEILV